MGISADLALRNGDVYEWVRCLNADQRHVEPMPVGITRPEGAMSHHAVDPTIMAMVVRTGCTLILIAPDGTVQVKPHETESDAAQCFGDLVQQIKYHVRMFAVVNKMRQAFESGGSLEDFDPFGAVPASSPDVVIIPDDLSGMPYSFGE